MDNGPAVCVSRAMRRALELVERFAPTPTAVLLVGPTGAGKEVLAQHLHRLSGRPGEFIDVNCGALPADLVEGELFGHRKGAFTGAVTARDGLIAAADRGTLFLDEVTSMPLAAQPKLLRVLETGEVRSLGATVNRHVAFRVVAAGQQDIRGRAAQGAFRPDLLYRLAGVVIEVPGLAARVEDIVPLARHFAASRGRVLRPAAESCLRAHDWPGNVRELRTAIERACVLSPDTEISAVGMVEAIHLGALTSTAADSIDPGELMAACRANDWDSVRTATALGIGRSTLFRRLKAARVSLRESRKSQDGLGTHGTIGAPGRRNGTASP